MYAKQSHGRAKNRMARVSPEDSVHIYISTYLRFAHIFHTYIQRRSLVRYKCTDMQICTDVLVQQRSDVNKPGNSERILFQQQHSLLENASYCQEHFPSIYYTFRRSSVCSRIRRSRIRPEALSSSQLVRIRLAIRHVSFVVELSFCLCALRSNIKLIKYRCIDLYFYHPIIESRRRNAGFELKPCAR